MALTVTPSLAGETTWYYDGLTDVYDNSNRLIGRAYRYKSISGQLRTMVNPGAVRDWAIAVGGNEHDVIRDVMIPSKMSNFKPPLNKDDFDRYLISDVFQASGATYTSTGTRITVTPATPEPPTPPSSGSLLDPPQSSVDSSIPLTATPVLLGQSTWYYDGVTEVYDHQNNLVGRASRYRSASGQRKTMVNPGLVREWAIAAGGNEHYVIAQVMVAAKMTNFQPPSPKVGFDRYLITDIFDAAGATYTDSGNRIQITRSAPPSVTNFSVTGAADANGCYAVGSKVNIEVNVKTNVPQAQTIKQIDVYASYPGTDIGATSVEHFKNVPVGADGVFKADIPFNVVSPEKAVLYIRAYDHIDRLDVDSERLQNTVGQVKPVGKSLEICSYHADMEADGQPLKFFNFKEDTLYYSRSLEERGPFGRSNPDIRLNPSNNSAWFGPIRFPTIYRGHPGEGANLTPGLNQKFQAEGHSGMSTVTAHPFKFIYVLGPADVPFAKPNEMIHPSLPTSTYNIQLTSQFNKTNVFEMFNGNADYVLQETDIHEIRKEIDNSKVGDFYYIRDLAEWSGADVSNAADPINDTNLQIYQTDWPDIDNFDFTDDNTFEVNERVNFKFDGYEYVSPRKDGTVRRNVDWSITIIDGPNKGGKSQGNYDSDKALNNPKKPHMARYDGYYQSRAAYFTPTQPGRYVVELKIVDEVQRHATKRLTFTIGEDGGACDPSVEDCDDVGPECDVNTEICFEFEIPPPDLTCRVEINTNESGNMTGQNLDADPRGTIREDSNYPESAVFDVLRYGIPSSEYLRVNGESEKYLTDYQYANKTGTVTYRFKVTKDYLYQWEEDGEVEFEHIRKEVDISDPYNISFWLVKYLTVLGFPEAIIRNYALPNELVSIMNQQMPTASGHNHPADEDHVFPVTCEGIYLGDEVITGKPPAGGPSENLESHAQLGSRTPNVKNDSAIVDGFVSMSDALVSQYAPTPTDIPRAPIVNVQKGDLQIDPLKVNKWRTPSSITTNYQTVFTINSSNRSLEFTGYSPDKINEVTVHTPVVMYAEASDNKELDQRYDPPERSTPPNPDDDRHAFILDQPFTVTLPTSGPHLDESIAPGYGDRDFEKYVRKDANGQAYNEVKFPFDVYSETKQAFYPSNQWIKIPTTLETAEFFLPTWVPEGEYEVKFRSVAINSPSSMPEEQQEEKNANLNLEYRTPNGVMDKHIAISSIQVDVVGRLYDFRVTDILDFKWESVFRSTEGLIEHTGNYYWVGDKMIDGDPRGNEKPFVLPIRHGSHPEGYKNLAVKTGYQFKFDMKTMGSMAKTNDAVSIKPSFYFVEKDGSNRRPVDVYYHSDSNYFVKIGSEQDKVYREVKLNEPLRNVEKKQLFDTAEYVYRHANDYGYGSIVEGIHDVSSFARKFERDYAKRPVKTGPYGWQILNWNLRTLIGLDADKVPSNSMIPPADVKASEQQWYGEYSLPADVYVVEQHHDIAGYGVEHRLAENSPIFLRDGYIIVNFDIETIANGNTENPHLSYYKGPLSNQWKREGFEYEFIDPYGNRFELLDGDVIFYHGDQSSYDDFGSSVTH